MQSLLTRSVFCGSSYTQVPSTLPTLPLEWDAFRKPLAQQHLRTAVTDLTHFDEQGRSHMVDVGDKPVTERMARASGEVKMAAETLRLIRDRGHKKGDVLEVARLAGIMGAKQTQTLIPLCHSLTLDAVEIAFEFPDDQTLAISAMAKVTAKTGVEMEALTAVSVTALTVYDMCKAVDRSMTIAQIRLEEKSGGRSGHYVRE